MSAPPLPLDSAPVNTRDDPSPVVVFEDVKLGFAENEVLRGVSFRLARGETKALFGVAGYGKNPILKLVMGVILPDARRILVVGRDIAQTRERDLLKLGGQDVR